MKLLKDVPHDQNLHYLLNRLQYASKMLKEFFHADGNGVSLENLDTKEFKVHACVTHGGDRSSLVPIPHPLTSESGLIYTASAFVVHYNTEKHTVCSVTCTIVRI